jgi:TRAP-type C4-dicarboxylate transport system permease small subunit
VSLGRAVERLTLVLAVLGVAAYAAAALVTVADVLARRWGGAVPGVVDLVQLCVLAGAYFVIPYTFVSDRHVSVDLLTARLPARAALLLKAFAAVLALAILAPMLVRTYGSALNQIAYGDRSQTLGIPLIWYWAPLVAGVGASILAAAVLLGRTLAQAFRGAAP